MTRSGVRPPYSPLRRRRSNPGTWVSTGGTEPAGVIFGRDEPFKNGVILSGAPRGRRRGGAQSKDPGGPALRWARAPRTGSSDSIPAHLRPPGTPLRMTRDFEEVHGQLVDGSVAFAGSDRGDGMVLRSAPPLPADARDPSTSSGRQEYGGPRDAGDPLTAGLPHLTARARSTFSKTTQTFPATRFCPSGVG